MSDAVIKLTTGQPGAGKTFSRVRWLVDDYLLTGQGHYITNLPLNIDVICSHLSKKTGKPISFFSDRIHVIPSDIMSDWVSLNDKSCQDFLLRCKECKTFPIGDYLEGFPLDNAHIAIDEFHRYLHKKSPHLLLEMWNNWFAEIRKLGCTFEAITQDPSLLPPEFMGKVGSRVDLIPLSTTRDPFFKISMGDWYELRAGLLGDREQRISEVEYRKGTSFSGRTKWVETRAKRFSITPYYFPFYNSYQQSEKDKSANVSFVSDRLGKKVIFWFIRRNFLSLFLRFTVVILFFWLTFLGGFLFIINGFTSVLREMGASNGGNFQKTQSEKIPVKSTVTVVPTSVSSSPVGVSSSLGSIPVSASASVSSASLASVSVSSDLSFRPAMFFEDSVYLANGFKVKVGYVFKGGIYDKKFIIKIDASERYYLLSDGVRVDMFSRL